MNDIGVMRCLNAGCYLRDNRRNFVFRKRRMLLGVTLQNFAFGPLDREKMQSGCFAYLDSLDDIGVLAPYCASRTKRATAVLSWRSFSRSTLSATVP